jgi:folate-binding protein YgfZ
MKRTPLAALHEARGARWMEHQGWEIPAWYSETLQEYQAIQEGVGLIDLSFRGLLRISGRDRRSWLHGQVTQDVNGLPDWRGAEATVLSPQGRMVCEMRVFALPDALLADVSPNTTSPMAEYLDRYLIMERAEIEDLTDTWGLLSLQGPLSARAAAATFGAEVGDMRMWDLRAVPCEGVTIYAARVTHCGEDGFDFFVPAERAAPVWASLCQNRPSFAVHSVGWEALNLRRVEAGVPWWGAELDPSIVPLEARLDGAIHPSKGCYVGQEIIARIHARGHVNNLLAGFLVHGSDLPAPDAEIRSDEKKVGRLTSAVRSPRLERPIALGYLRRELQEPGTRVQAATAAGSVEMEVAALPFIPHDFPEGGSAAGSGRAPNPL